MKKKCFFVMQCIAFIFAFVTSCSEKEVVSSEPEVPENPDVEEPDVPDTPTPTPDEGEVLPLNVEIVDNTTIIGKAMFGYQGWFSHPDDKNAPFKALWHWGAKAIQNPPKVTVEMYPDFREYCSDEKYRSGFKYSTGEMAPLYSAGNKRTVFRHMKWLRDYHLDGVFLQRFLSEVRTNKQIKDMRDLTTKYIMEGCEKYGRIFAIMYDGIHKPDVNVDELIKDWKHLIDDIGITKSSRYLHHDGLPVVTIYGYCVNKEQTAESLKQIMEFFTNCPEQKYRASVMLTLGNDWCDSKYAEFHESFKKAKIISHWSVGRYYNIDKYNSNYLREQFLPYKNWCDENDILFVPVIFPGFSWVNLKGENEIPNKIPRQGGTFMWEQAYKSILYGSKSLYFAMFDEVDEATCYYKIAENASMSPYEGWWLNLDADGYELPSDWYLRCASKATLALTNKKYLTPDLGIPPLGGVTIYPVENTTSCGMKICYPDFEGDDYLSISVDNGKTWPYKILDNSKMFFIPLEPGVYEVYVRQGDDGESVPMGEINLSKMSN